MPKLVRREKGGLPGQDSHVRGLLAPEQDPLSVDEIIAECAGIDMCYMCRAYSEENRPGFHGKKSHVYSEENGGGFRGKNLLLKSVNLVLSF